MSTHAFVVDIYIQMSHQNKRPGTHDARYDRKCHRNANAAGCYCVRPEFKLSRARELPTNFCFANCSLESLCHIHFIVLICFAITLGTATFSTCFRC